jgi:drug/metabolite transporter (DMT)-like permease
MLSYLLAVLAACANATSSVLQRKANREVPQNQNLSLRLIVSLVHEPVWFGGVLAVIAGFLLQATALGNGQLSVVEPILVLELPATLMLASRVFGSRMHAREWGAAAAMTVALAGLLFFLSPSAGQPMGVRWYAWVIAMGANLIFVAAMVAWGRHGPAGRDRDRKGEESSARQAAVLGVAAGSTFGLTAALMKGMTNTFSQGFGALFTSWQLYGMIAAGALGMFLLQSAMNAGRLIAAQPGLTLSDPIISVLWGVLVFHEHVRGGWFIALALISGLVLAGAVVALARSPLLSGESARTEEDQRSTRTDQDEHSARRHVGDDAPAGPPGAERPDGDGAGAAQNRPARGAPRGGGRS